MTFKYPQASPRPYVVFRKSTATKVRTPLFFFDLFPAFIITNNNNSSTADLPLSASTMQQLLLFTLFAFVAASASVASTQYEVDQPDLLSHLHQRPLNQGPFTEVHVFTEHSSFSTTNFPRKYNVSGDSLDSLSFTSLEDGYFWCEAKNVAVDAKGRFKFQCDSNGFGQAVCHGQFTVLHHCHSTRNGPVCGYSVKTPLTCASLEGEGHHKIVVSYSS
ncbi:hypothetical protein PROFUN_11988 [Planoprotostelium fungivorum]|uniref:Uncharacterized protein n=1 Tax=Planoprotostelium fungivorum TaxID=1890364 RepID=A0A2P6N8X8_9EUKA|nr:hypothetical protein PROFUN_11988 [Planoprotostelium fungivorum]